MKTKFLIFSMLFTLASGVMFASFPVQKKETVTHVSQTQTSEAQQLLTQDLNQVETLSEASEYESPAAESGKSQLIALILVIVVGGLGIHRFYLGYTWQGVVQLLTLGGCGIWTLIDLIMIATGDLKPKGGEYSETL